MKRILLLFLTLSWLATAGPAAHGQEQDDIAEAITAIREGVREGALRETLEARQTLLDIGDAAAGPLLTALFAPAQEMTVEEMQVRDRYLETLLEINPADLLPAVKGAFFSPDTHVWLRDALRRLMMARDPGELRTTLLNWYGSNTRWSEFVVADGVQLLSACANEETDEFFLGWLKEKNLDREKLRLALRVIARRKIGKASARLVEMLSDADLVGDLTALEELTRCLGELRVREAVPILEALLKEQHGKLFQAQYYGALGWIGSEEAVDILLAELQRLGEEKRYSDCIPVVIALGDSGAQRAAQVLAPYLRKGVLRTYVIAALGKLKVKSTARLLVEYLDDAELTALVAAALRDITGEHFGYTKGREPEKDAEAIAAWKKYIQTLEE